MQMGHSRTQQVHSQMMQGHFQMHLSKIDKPQVGAAFPSLLILSAMPVLNPSQLPYNILAQSNCVTACLKVKYCPVLSALLMMD